MPDLSGPPVTIHVPSVRGVLPGLRHCEPWALAGRGNPDFAMLRAQRAIQNGSIMRVVCGFATGWILTPWLTPGLRMTGRGS